MNPSSSFVGLDSAEVATSVIRSLRASSNSSRNYKQNATRDDYIIQNVCEFNKLINDKVSEIEKQQSFEAKLNNAIASYSPAVTEAAAMMGSPTASTSPAAKIDDELSSDEERGPSRGKKDVRPRVIKRSESDEDLLNDNDDEDDNRELFKNFTAPHTASPSTRTSSVSLKLGTGKGGIRGIQELQKFSGSGALSSLSGSGATGVTSSQQAARIAAIAHNAKPGQAIRVRAHGSSGGGHGGGSQQQR
jgi:hypothetical protein